MSTLKNNNARLTSALQESTANVEEWKRQLHSYKEDNTKLKMGLIELEAGRGTTIITININCINEDTSQSAHLQTNAMANEAHTLE